MRDTLFLVVIFTVGFYVGFKHADDTYIQRHFDLPAACGTDLECLELCPEDDKGCDGGPEPARTVET